MALDASIPLKANNAAPVSTIDTMMNGLKMRAGQQQIQTGQQEQQLNQLKMQQGQQSLDAGQIDMMLKKQQAVAQVLGSVKDQAGWDQALQWAQQNGLGDVAGQLPRVYDKNTVDGLMLRTLDAGKKLQLQMEQSKLTETNRHNLATEAGGGQKPPAGYRPTPTGDLEPIPGGPATKLPGNEAAQMALLNTSLDNMTDIRKAFGKDFGLQSSADYGLERGDVGQGKRLVTAGIEAALRAMSGAAVPKEEVARYSNLYLPTPMDSEPTRTKKLNELEKFMQAAASNMNQGRSNDTTFHGTVLTAPPPQGERKIGQTYQTPKGPMMWQGQGWVPTGGAK